MRKVRSWGHIGILLGWGALTFFIGIAGLGAQSRLGYQLPFSSSLGQGVFLEKALPKKEIAIAKHFSLPYVLQQYRTRTFKKWRETSPHWLSTRKLYRLPFLLGHRFFEKGDRRWEKKDDDPEVIFLKMTVPEKTQPDVAYNSQTGHFFVVWAQATEEGSQIYGELKDQQGQSMGEGFFLVSIPQPNNPETGEPYCLPPDFFDRFSDPRFDFSELSHPTECTSHVAPAITYNPVSERFLVVWEARIIADYPEEFPFSVTLGMQYREEGGALVADGSAPKILNRYHLALSVPATPVVPYVLHADNVLAWSSAETPDIVASQQRGHSLLAYSTNAPASLSDLPGQGWNASSLNTLLQYYGIQMRAIASGALPLPPPVSYRSHEDHLSMVRPRVDYHPATETFLAVFEVDDLSSDLSGVGGVPLTINDSNIISAGEDIVSLVAWEGASGVATFPDVTAHGEGSPGQFMVVYREESGTFQGIKGAYVNTSGANLGDFPYVSDVGEDIATWPRVSYSLGSVNAPHKGHMLVFERANRVWGSFLKDGALGPDQSLLVSTQSAIANQTPALTFNPFDSEDEIFYVVWSQVVEGVSLIAGKRLPLLAPQVTTFEATPPALQVGQATQLGWETLNAASVSISPDIGGGLSVSGSQMTLPLMETTEFILTASGPGGETVVPITVNVYPFGAPEIINFIITPTSIAEGADVILSWEVTADPGDAALIFLESDDGTVVMPSSPSLAGSFVWNPLVTDQYRLVVEGLSGTVTSDLIEVGVVPLVAPVLNAVPDPLAPTRAYLSWNDVGASGYDVYFVEGAMISPGVVPYKSDVTGTHFVIQASTDNRPQYEPDVGVAAIYLEPDTTYTWKVVARTSLTTAASVPQTFSTDDSVVGWWRFDEGAGDVALDYSGNGNEGTRIIDGGGSDWVPDLVLGGGYNFGDQSYFNCDNSESLNFTSPGISIEAWVYYPSLSSSSGIIHKGNQDGGSGQYVLVFTNQNVSFRLNWSAGTALAIGPFSANIWHHIIATYDGSSMKIYIDGVEESSEPFSENISSSDTLLYIGRFSENSSNFDGMMDEVILYEKPLEANEVTDHFLLR